MSKSRTYINKLAENTGKSVMIKGWVGLGFVVVPTQEVEFVDDEIIDFKWLTPEELQSFIDTETNYCSPLPLVFEKAESFRKEHFIN